MNEQLAFSIKEHVLELGAVAGVEILFLKTRRQTDLARFAIIGEKERVLSLPTVFEERFQEQAIEIIQAMQQNQGYSLTMVITEKLESHPLHFPERRNKLLRLQEAID